METFWIENIYNSIKDYSDIEKQKKLWQGLDKNYISSYIEDYSILFYDNDFDDFIKVWKNEDRNRDVLREMIAFRKVLTSYDNSISKEKMMKDIEVLEDPNWLLVVNQAKKVIKAWDEYNGGK